MITRWNAPTIICSIAIAEARWGLAAIPILPQLLSRLGSGRLRRYSLSCERFEAKRAFEIGLIDEICASGKLNETAEPIVDALLHCPSDALAATKAGVLKFSGLFFTEDELEAMAQIHAKRRVTKSASEGVRSYLEKRKPSWYPPSSQNSVK